MVTVSYRNHSRSERWSSGLSEGVDSIATKIALIFELAGREIVLTRGGTTMESGTLDSFLTDEAQGSSIIYFFCRGEEADHTPP